MSLRGICVLLICAALAAPAAAQEEQESQTIEDQGVLAEYPVRWDHGGTSDFGILQLLSASILFTGDDGGEVKFLPILSINELLIVNTRWIQVRTNVETGLSWGRNDVYNFGVIGTTPDPAVIMEFNRLVAEAKRVRVESAAALPGERARYMTSKAEGIGDDIGLLIITEDGIAYRSDTGNRDHEWPWEYLSGVEIVTPEELKVHVSAERSPIKFGAHRVYQFISQSGPWKPEDLAFMIGKIAEAAASRQ